MGMQSSSLSTISHWSYCYQQLDLTTFWTCQVARGQLHTCQEPLITGCKFFFRFKTNLIYNTFSGLSLINFHSSKPSKIHSDFQTFIQLDKLQLAKRPRANHIKLYRFGYERKLYLRMSFKEDLGFEEVGFGSQKQVKWTCQAQCLAYKDAQ